MTIHKKSTQMSFFVRQIKTKKDLSNIWEVGLSQLKFITRCVRCVKTNYYNENKNQWVVELRVICIPVHTIGRHSNKAYQGNTAVLVTYPDRKYSVSLTLGSH